VSRGIIGATAVCFVCAWQEGSGCAYGGLVECSQAGAWLNAVRQVSVLAGGKTLQLQALSSSCRKGLVVQ
jgi:hypothetical protein